VRQSAECITTLCLIMPVHYYSCVHCHEWTLPHTGQLEGVEGQETVPMIINNCTGLLIYGCEGMWYLAKSSLTVFLILLYYNTFYVVRLCLLVCMLTEWPGHLRLYSWKNTGHAEPRENVEDTKRTNF